MKTYIGLLKEKIHTIRRHLRRCSMETCEASSFSFINQEMLDRIHMNLMRKYPNDFAE